MRSLQSQDIAVNLLAVGGERWLRPSKRRPSPPARGSSSWASFVPKSTTRHEYSPSFVEIITKQQHGLTGKVLLHKGRTAVKGREDASASHNRQHLTELVVASPWGARRRGGYSPPARRLGSPRRGRPGWRGGDWGVFKSFHRVGCWSFGWCVGTWSSYVRVINQIETSSTVLHGTFCR